MDWKAFLKTLLVTAIGAAVPALVQVLGQAVGGQTDPTHAAMALHPTTGVVAGAAYLLQSPLRPKL